MSENEHIQGILEKAKTKRAMLMATGDEAMAKSFSMLILAEGYESLKSTLAERDAELGESKGKLDYYRPLAKDLIEERKSLKATIAEYSSGWEKMRGGIKMMSSFAGNVRPEEGCRLVCVRAKELLAIKQPSVAKAGDEPQPNREDLK